MIWNLPLIVRIVIVFVCLPLIDRLYNLIRGKHLIDPVTLYYLEYYPRAFYMYGWLLLFKTFIVSLQNIIIDYFNSYNSYDGYDSYNNNSTHWILYTLMYFIISYGVSKFHMYYRYRFGRTSKYLAYLSLIFSISTILYHTYFLLNDVSNIKQYLANDLVWQHSLGLFLIYRYLIEVIIRSLD